MCYLIDSCGETLTLPHPFTVRKRSATEQLPQADVLLDDISAGQETAVILYQGFLSDVHLCTPSTGDQKRPWIPAFFTLLRNNKVTNENNLWSQSVTNKIILLRGHKLISIHLGHSCF